MSDNKKLKKLIKAARELHEEIGDAAAEFLATKPDVTVKLGRASRLVIDARDVLEAALDEL